MLPLLASLVLAMGPGLHAAERVRQDDVREILLAALPPLRPLLPQGRAAVDARMFCSARLLGWNCPDDVRKLTDSLGRLLGSREFTYVCIGGPTSCRLIGVRSLIDLESPEIRDGAAQVDVELVTASGQTGVPPATRRYRVALLRRRGRWDVTGVHPLR